MAHLAADVRPLVRLSVTVIAEQNGRREVGSGGGGGRFGLAYFDDAMRCKTYVNEAVPCALTNLEAQASTCRCDDRGVRPWLAGRVVARGHWPRS